MISRLDKLVVATTAADPERLRGGGHDLRGIIVIGLAVADHVLEIGSRNFPAVCGLHHPVVRIGPRPTRRRHTAKYQRSGCESPHGVFHSGPSSSHREGSRGIVTITAHLIPESPSYARARARLPRYHARARPGRFRLERYPEPDE
jgi:hypothetical protein